MQADLLHRAFVHFLIWSSLALTAISVLLGVFQIGTFLWDLNVKEFATPQKEKAAATEQFLWSCSHNHLNPRDFDGPYREYGDNSVHNWVWRVKKVREEHIAVHISYMPYDVSDTISTVLVESHTDQQGKTTVR